MQIKKLIIVAVVLALIAGVMLLLKQSGAPQRDDEEALVGTPLLDPSIMEQAQRIRIFGEQIDYIADPENPGKEPREVKTFLETNLELDAKGRWVQAEFYGMPASEDRMKEVFDGYTQGKIIRYITSDGEESERLKLGTENYEFYDASGDLIKKVELADIGEFYYYYVRFDDDAAVYMVAHDTFFDPGPNNWRDRALFTVSEKTIHKIEIEYPKVGLSMRFERASQESKWESPDQPEGRFLFQEKVDRAMSKLVGSDFVNAIPKDSKRVQAAAENIVLSAVLRSFDGVWYSYEIGLLPPVLSRDENPDGRVISGKLQERAIVFMSASDPDHPSNEWNQTMAFSYMDGDVYDLWPKSLDKVFLEPLELEKARFVDSPDFEM